MALKRFNLSIAVHISLLVLISAAGTYYYFARGADLGFVLLLLVLAIVITSLIIFFNKTNEEISTFLSSVLNEDSSLVFNENTGNRSYDRLHRSLNKLNEQIKDARMSMVIQEKFYQAVVENSSGGLLAFDNKGVIKLANSKTKELLGTGPLHNIHQLNRVNKELEQALEKIKAGDRLLLSIIIDESLLHLSLEASELRMKDEKVKVVALNDISHEINRQEVESWQKLTRILNHEIMNSIAPLTSLSSTISGFYKTDGRQKKISEIDESIISRTIRGLTVIEEHGKSLVSFVDSYRSLTRLPELKPSEIRVRDFFESIILLVSSIKNDLYPSVDLSVSARVEPEDLMIRADESLMSRVLFNLVKNSLEAMQETDDPRLLLEAEKDPRGRNIIRVTDNGPGISSEILDNIFVPFFTTREKGSGIGLSLSRQIVNMHKGNITAKSSPGRGTAIIISI